jgi:flagellar biosynthesis/type III secretory pathway protein FliH
MTKYRKFVFQDLAKSLVVNTSEVQDIDEHKEAIINDVITQHLSNIINEVPSPLDIEEDAAEDVQDIEHIKALSYNQGAEDSKIHYEAIINQLQLDNDFAQILHQKIQNITNRTNIDHQIAKLSGEIIASIAKKIYLVLPVDFERMLEKALLSRLEQFYKEGQIKLIIHPSRYDFCVKILDARNILEKYSDNFHIIQDERLNENDCRLEWLDTTLEYNQEQLHIEINAILEQIQNHN